MRIQTDAFQDKGKIPVKFCMPGAGGSNISIPLLVVRRAGRCQILRTVDYRPAPTKNCADWPVCVSTGRRSQKEKEPFPDENYL